MEDKDKETTSYLTAKIVPKTNLVTLTGDSKEIIRIENNGEIFVHGRLIGNDKEVVDALREFLTAQGYLGQSKDM